MEPHVTELAEALLVLLLVHAGLGAIDTFAFHELREHLPARPWAARELLLHSLRSLLFVVIFLGLAWFEWHGLFGLLIFAVVVIEYVVTIADSIAEDRTRRLSAPERTNHMLLALNTGLYTGLLVLLLVARWWHEPTAIVRAHHPALLSVALSFAAAGVAVWAARDAIASHRLERRSPSPPPRASGVAP
jgi:uncharacterized protein